MQNLTVAQVLDRARDLNNMKSDYALCKALDFSTQQVANWRHGRSLPDEKSCIALASIANLDAHVLIAQMNAQRAKDSGARAIWQAIAERLQLSAAHAMAVILSVVVAMGFGATDAYAAGASAQQAKADRASNSLYIVSIL